MAHKTPGIHVQDIEDYYSEFHRKKFYGIIDGMRDAEDEFKISYELMLGSKGLVRKALMVSSPISAGQDHLSQA